MARTVYYAAASLDGYIADTEETLSWLLGFEGAGYAGGEAPTPMGEGGSYQEFFAGVGSLAMGSKTYEFIQREGGWAYGEMPAWVYTRRELEPIDGAEGLSFASGDVADLHAEILDAGSGKDLWVIGGGDLASQYVDAGLLDVVRVTVVPILLGEGLPLFARPLPRPLRLLAVTPFANGMAELSYEVMP